MRVTFEQAQLSGVYVDDCQFYVVPTGADSGGAAVVQCRRGMTADFGLEGLAGEPAAGFFNRRRSARERGCARAASFAGQPLSGLDQAIHSREAARAARGARLAAADRRQRRRVRVLPAASVHLPRGAARLYLGHISARPRIDLGNVAPIQISEEEIARMSEGASVCSRSSL